MLNNVFKGNMNWIIEVWYLNELRAFHVRGSQMPNFENIKETDTSSLLLYLFLCQVFHV